jgi:hypothetical protein
MTLPTVKRSGKFYLSTGRVAQRYGEHPRTTIRHLRAGLLPKPDLTINGRYHWLEETLDRHDQANPKRSNKAASANASAPTQ